MSDALKALMKSSFEQYRRDNPAESCDPEDYRAGFATGYEAGRRARVSPPKAERITLDGDTLQNGVKGPFEYWESDGTALVHVLWSAKHQGLTLIDDADEIYPLILRSRWFAAAKAAAAAPRTIDSLHMLDALFAGTVVRSDDNLVFSRVTDAQGSPAWQTIGSTRKVATADIALPVTVLVEAVA